MMNNIKIAKGVYYVGAVDWDQRNFHGYHTPRGVTYNAYLIVDEKICLIDTVKAAFAEELLDRISAIVDPAKIDYVISNHAEPDHSGALPRIMEKAANAKVVLTASGKEGVSKQYQQQFDCLVVKEGDILDLGCNKLHFVPLPMLHWPDSMACYLDGEQILFSNDAFGQHICTTKRFDDENDVHDTLFEAAKYYANILMPYSRLIGKALDKAQQSPIKMIAPSHGLIWRSHIADILRKYEQWGKGYTTDTIVIVYDTMWGATEKIARGVLEGAAAAGAKVKIHRLNESTLSDILTDILEAGGVLVGSSTQHNGVLASVGGFLTYLKGLRPANKLGAAFSTYGWSGGAQNAIEEMLKASGIMVEQSGLSIKWVAGNEEWDKCFQFGAEFAQKVLEKTNK
jgi:flavorubredoxin